MEIRHERTDRTVLVLPQRVNWAEVEKALQEARMQLAEDSIPPTDDAVWFVATDDGIRIELPAQVSLL